MSRAPSISLNSPQTRLSWFPSLREDTEAEPLRGTPSTSPRNPPAQQLSTSAPRQAQTTGPTSSQARTRQIGQTQSSTQQQTVPANMSKEIKIAPPFLFKGDESDRSRAPQWIFLLKNYIGINQGTYDTDEKKIRFGLSYLQDGPAGQWAKMKMDILQARPAGWGTIDRFIQDFKEAFITQNESEEAIHKLDELRQGKGSVLAYNAQFETLIQQTGLSDFIAIQEKYLKGLNTDIARDIVRDPTQPTTKDELYRLAIKKGAVKERLSKLNLAIFQGPSNRFTNNQPFRRNNPFRNNFNRPTNGNQSYNSWNNGNQNRNNNPRPFNRLDPQERARLMKEGRCFICKQTGHNARNCTQKQTNIRNMDFGNNEWIEPNEPRNQTDNNPFRNEASNLDVTAIRSAIADLSVGDFSKLMEDIETLPDFQ